MKLAYSILLLVFSILIISEITGIYFLYEFKINMEDQIMKESERENSMMINRIDSYATERLVDLINLGRSDTIVTAIQTSNTQFSKMADPEQYVNEMDTAWISAPANETTPFMKTLIDSPPSEQLHQIENAENALFEGRVYGEIFMTNQYGANVIESDKTSDYKQSDETWWQEARKNGIYIGGAEFDNSSKVSSYTVATRLDDENGNFIGVVKGIVNIEQILNIIKNQMNVTNNTPIEYELMSNENTVIYSTDHSEKPFSQNQEPEYKGNLNKKSGHFEYTSNDKKYLVTYARSTSAKISPLFNWIFVTKYKAEDVLQPVIQLTDQLITITIILILTVSAIVFTVSRKIAAPIELIRVGLESYRKKEIVEIKPHGVLELKILAEHFNHMVETLSKSQDIISKSEEKFKTIFEVSPVCIIITDENYVIKSFNQRFLEIFRYDHNEIIDKSAYMIISERSRKQFESYKIEAKDRVLKEKVWLVKKDMVEFPCLINAQKIYDKDKKFLGNLAVIEDISDIEEAKEQIIRNQIKLRNSENLYRGLFELSPDPIRISTPGRVTMEINDAALKKFGYNKDELVGKSIFLTVNETSIRDIENVFETLGNGKIVENMEASYRKKDGTNVPVLLSASRFYDQSGNPIGNIEILKDISEISETRKKIKEDEEKLLNQYMKIKQADELKDQFSSMISHELTTPLFPIKFQAEMLKDPKILGELNKEQYNAINEIYQNAVQLEKLISDILDAQKLEMNVMKFIKTKFELNQFMNTIFDTGKNLIVGRKIEFENSSKDHITLSSDPDRLTQVFTNLIKNSVDFVPENTGIIEIGTKVQENDILFYVKDNGIGIPKNKQVNLFKKFYQIDTSLKRSHRGSGLGLSICKGIVEGLGGKIWLESTEGLGTIVYFTIPKGD